MTLEDAIIVLLCMGHLDRNSLHRLAMTGSTCAQRELDVITEAEDVIRVKINSILQPRGLEARKP